MDNTSYTENEILQQRKYIHYYLATMWLLAYMITIRGWLANSSRTLYYIANYV